jgi:hypothetical protein
LTLRLGEDSPVKLFRKSLKVDGSRSGCIGKEENGGAKKVNEADLLIIEDFGLGTQTA